MLSFHLERNGKIAIAIKQKVIKGTKESRRREKLKLTAIKFHTTENECA